MDTPNFDTLAERSRFSAEEWRTAWEVMVSHFGPQGQMTVWSVVRDGANRLGGRPASWVDSVIAVSNAHPL